MSGKKVSESSWGIQNPSFVLFLGLIYLGIQKIIWLVVGHSWHQSVSTLVSKIEHDKNNVWLFNLLHQPPFKSLFVVTGEKTIQSYPIFCGESENTCEDTWSEKTHPTFQVPVESILINHETMDCQWWMIDLSIIAQTLAMINWGV